MSPEVSIDEIDAYVTGVVAALLDTKPGAVTGATALAAIEGWDSVNALRVLTYLERSLGATLNYERFAAAETVGDLAAVAGAAAGANRDD